MDELGMLPEKRQIAVTQSGDRLSNKGAGEAQEGEIRKNTYNKGRPTGATHFIEKLKTLVGRCLKDQKPGRKKRNT